MHNKKHYKRLVPAKDEGVALILVLLVVALASILVVQLAYSTYIGARINAHTERSLQAEYLLKSSLTLARVLIQTDETSEATPKDTWAFFRNGVVIPPEWIGLQEPNIRVSLEIRPEESKFPLRLLIPSGNLPDPKVQKMLTRLFTLLGFDKDEEQDQTGLFPNTHFSPEQLVAILVDYMDNDKESYKDGSYLGIESDLKEEIFPNQPIVRLGELASIPGFTPTRIRKLLPLLTTRQISALNINFASPVVMQALHQDIDNGTAEQIVSYRNEGDGFTEAEWVNQIQSFLSNDILFAGPEAIKSYLQVQSHHFEVIGKVDYGTSSYFMRAYLWKQRGIGGIPKIVSVEFF